MSNDAIGMGQQDRETRNKYENELNRIIEASNNAGVILRVIGSLAFQIHCPEYGYIQEMLGRSYTDIDFAAYRSQISEIQTLMVGLGYVERKNILLFSEGDRSIFDHHDIGIYVDVFYGKLDFCHVIKWNDRLEVDFPTIPLAEMLLEKMQIVEINEKDIIDTVMLLVEHPLADGDEETVNIQRIAKLCSQDWGLWRTTTMNLEKVKLLSQNYDKLGDDRKILVANQIDTALTRIEDEPKTMAWRIRSRVGDRVKWYKEVDDVH
ncbi:MAG: hypothetical protein MUO62_12460 [Anaerolineales bacterium]|nr:hypothetical protein [Anaerolineales bacterium]